MNRIFILVAAAILFALPAMAGAVEKSITLPPDDAYAELTPGPGVEVVRAHCVLYHSTDYIVIQPRGDAKQWQGVVTKMRKTYRAVINEQDAQTIVEYLVSAHGPTH